MGAAAERDEGESVPAPRALGRESAWVETLGIVPDRGQQMGEHRVDAGDRAFRKVVAAEFERLHRPTPQDGGGGIEAQGLLDGPFRLLASGEVGQGDAPATCYPVVKLRAHGRLP